MQQGDYSSVSYYQYPQNLNPNPNPNPNPVDHHPNPLPPTYASAPPFTNNYSSSSSSSSDYSPYSSTYPPYAQNPDPLPSIPPTAPSFSPTPNSHPSPSPSPSPSVPYDQQGPYHPSPHPQSSYYPPYDPPNFAPPSSLPPNPIPSPLLNPQFSTPYAPTASSVPPLYDNSFDSNLKFDQGAAYLDEPSGRYASYGRSKSDLGSDFYGKRPESALSRHDSGAYHDDGYGYGDGVYAYQGSKVEPYGARGTAPKSSTWSGFDDFGRPIAFPSGKDQSASAQIVRAVPKADTQPDVKSGVQKFRVKLLPEGGGNSTMDVLCQVHQKTL